MYKINNLFFDLNLEKFIMGSANSNENNKMNFNLTKIPSDEFIGSKMESKSFDKASSRLWYELL